MLFRRPVADEMHGVYDHAMEILPTDTSRRRFLGTSLQALLVAGFAAPTSRNALVANWQKQRWLICGAKLCDGGKGSYHLVCPSGTAYRINQTGLALWGLCDGQRTGEHIVQAFRATHGISQARAQKDVRAFLQTMMKEGLVKTT